MDDSSLKRVAEQFAGTHLIHEQEVAPEVSGIASNPAVTVTAKAFTDNQGQPFVVVDWHPHAHYSALTRVDQTDHNKAEPLLNAYDPTFPTYNDWGVQLGHRYVYELAVPNAPRNINPSQPVTPTPPTPTPPPDIPDLGIIDRVFQPEQPIEIRATELNDVAQKKLEE